MYVDLYMATKVKLTNEKNKMQNNKERKSHRMSFVSWTTKWTSRANRSTQNEFFEFFVFVLFIISQSVSKSPQPTCKVVLFLGRKVMTQYTVSQP